MRYGAAILGLLLVVGGTRADVAERKPIVIDFDLLESKHIAVMVKINGKGPYRLLFDTGAPTILVNNRVARESGVLDKEARKPALSVFGAMGQFPIKSLEFGNHKVGDVAAVVMDHPLLEVMSKAVGPVEGIIGFPFFARYRMTLDYQAKRMTLVPNGYEPVDLVQKIEAALLDASKPKARIVAPAAQWGLVVDKDEQDEEAGVKLKQVLAGGAAAEAGLRSGDRLLTLDGRWTDSVADCYEAVRHVPPGSAVPVVVERGGKKMTITVKPRPGL